MIPMAAMRAAGVGDSATFNPHHLHHHHMFQATNGNMMETRGCRIDMAYNGKRTTLFCCNGSWTLLCLFFIHRTSK